MKMNLDRIDFDILRELQKDARLSNKALAARIGRAPSSCLERVRALDRAGVLRGYHAEVSGAALGVGLEALIAVRLARHSQAAFKGLCAHFLSLVEVLAVLHVSGPNDLQVHVAVRDVQHLRDLLLERFATRKEVTSYETAVIFEARRKDRLPCYVGAPEDEAKTPKPRGRGRRS